jgi:putative ABC transport system permease protein
MLLRDSVSTPPPHGRAHQGIPMPPTPGTNRLLPVQLALDSGSVAKTLLLGVVTSVTATLLTTMQVLSLSIVQAIRSAA